MSKEYLATGFTKVDEAKDIDAYGDCLSLLDSLPYYKTYKQNTYKLLNPGNNSRILDAGCGLGDDVFRLAENLSGSSIVIGVDASKKLIEKAKSDSRNHHLSTEFQVGDLKNLEFDNNFFTHCRIDRVLQHIPDPLEAIIEIVRVMDSNGSLVAYDNDWSTFKINSSNASVTKIIQDKWCHSFTNSFVGRELEQLFYNAGLIKIEVYPATSSIESYDIANKIYNLELTVKRAIEEKIISERDGIEWLDELRKKCASGTLEVELTGYTVVGYK